MVRGSSPGPCSCSSKHAPAVHGSPCPAGARVPQRKLRRNVPRVGRRLLTVQPSTLPVPPQRSASASSMQSPPARAGATRVIILFPAFALPGASPRSNRVPLHQFAQSQSAGECERQQQSCIGHQAVIVEGYADALGTLGCYHLKGAPALGLAFVPKTIIPQSMEHFSRLHPPHQGRYFRWIRAKGDELAPAKAGGWVRVKSQKSLPLKS